MAITKEEVQDKFAKYKREKEEEGGILVGTNIVPSLVDKYISHGLVIPKGCFASRHEADASDTIDDAVVVTMATLVVGHRLSILTTIGIGTASWSVHLLRAKADEDRVIWVMIDNRIIF